MAGDHYSPISTQLGSAKHGPGRGGCLVTELVMGDLRHTDNTTHYRHVQVKLECSNSESTQQDHDDDDGKSMWVVVDAFSMFPDFFCPLSQWCRPTPGQSAVSPPHYPVPRGTVPLYWGHGATMLGTSEYRSRGRDTRRLVTIAWSRGQLITRPAAAQPPCRSKYFLMVTRKYYSCSLSHRERVPASIQLP